MYIIIIGKIVLFIGFKRGLLDNYPALTYVKSYLLNNFSSPIGLECISDYFFKKANSHRRDTVPGDCETILGQYIIINYLIL